MVQRGRREKTPDIYVPGLSLQESASAPKSTVPLGGMLEFSGDEKRVLAALYGLPGAEQSDVSPVLK